MYLLFIFSLLFCACSSTPKPMKKERTKALTLMEKQKLRQQKNALGMSKNQKTNPNAELFASQDESQNQENQASDESQNQASDENQDEPQSSSQTKNLSSINQSVIDLKTKALAEIIKEPSTQILDKAGVFKRLKQYPLCMVKDQIQRDLIPVRIYPFMTSDTLIYDVIEVECVFFAYQGSFEYWLFERTSGMIEPLSFDFAQKIEIQGNERITPAMIREDLSYELCGIPKIIEKKGIQSICKGDAGGTCGAYAEFELDLENLQFKKIKAKAKACTDQISLAPVNTDPDHWPDAQTLKP